MFARTLLLPIIVVVRQIVITVSAIFPKRMDVSDSGARALL